ncbi:MAG: sensor histidine kinase [Chitinophagales bacterium]
MNRLLKRQVRKFLGGMDNIPPEMMPFIDAINKSYTHFEEDRTLLERAMDISSEELHVTNTKLRADAKKQKAILVKLRASLNTLLSVKKTEGESIDISNDEDILGVIDLIETQSNKLKNYEEKQRKLIEKLAAANEELTSYAYVVSHDLKAPLRGIGSITDWLVEDYSDILDDDGRHHLKLLKKRVTRMHNLIEGILAYSRIGRKDEKIDQMNLNELLSDMVDSMAPGKPVQMNVKDNLPKLLINRTRITQILQNLVSNAIKYNNKDTIQIDIEGEMKPNGWILSVRDNGPGIDEKYHKKIFQIFQTLQKRDKYESTGVGLTVVKKIMDQYQGEVWIKSSKGKGATFYLEFPLPMVIMPTPELLPI